MTISYVFILFKFNVAGHEGCVAVSILKVEGHISLQQCFLRYGTFVSYFMRATHFTEA